MHHHNHLRANIFQLQALELRRYLTAASVDSTHHLIVTGGTGDDTITVSRASGNTDGKTIVVSGVNKTFTYGTGSGQYTQIRVDGSTGKDTITLATNIVYDRSTLIGGG